MRSFFFFIIILSLYLLGACDNQQFLTFRAGVDTVKLVESDVQTATLDEDSSGNKAVEIHLSNSGQQKILNITQKNIGNTLSVLINDKIILKDVPIVSPASHDTFTLSVEELDVIDSIVNTYNSKH